MYHSLVKLLVVFLSRRGQCPIWLHEKQVQKLKAEKGCSFVEARKQ